MSLLIELPGQNNQSSMEYSELRTYWDNNRLQHWRAYRHGGIDFIPYLLPERAVQIPGRQVLDLLASRLGVNSLQEALNPEHTVASPISQAIDSSWLKEVNMVGINVRTIDSFWNVVKYALTLPRSQSSIHLLPIWEPGVVASLYGIASWNINPEFFSSELVHLVPQLNTVEKQLKAVTNLLHAMGKTVGMDVIPHTDRYSEVVLANPHYFEWLQRDQLQIVDHHANMHLQVQEAILSWLVLQGPAIGGLTYPRDADAFFGEKFSEQERLRVLFGYPHQQGQRLDRRDGLIDWLYHKGLEPVPATMGPPYRGLEVDPSPDAKTIDKAGRVWHDYRITQPQEMSRVFGPLTRFKLYERQDDNAHWAIDFSRPRPEVWHYFCEKYAAVQSQYGFDFMRGDMSHVQMRAEGIPEQIDDYYDPLRAVKLRIQKQVPYFGYYAESFLAPPDFMAYGDEVDHLEASEADSTLGNLQSMVVGSLEFMQNFRWYLDLINNRKVAPNFTIMTGDKDDPRFDEFYLKGNEIRLFIGLFLTDMPSYMALGFEQRDPHLEPAPNEHYTKLYVFQIEKGPKKTHGPYHWGQNGPLFYRLQRIRELAEVHLPTIQHQSIQWLTRPDPTAEQQFIAWTQQEQPQFLFVANLDIENELESPVVEGLPNVHSQPLFSTHREDLTGLEGRYTDGQFQLPHLLAGEGLCFEIAY